MTSATCITPDLFDIYPRSWLEGTPDYPCAQTRDLRPLPGGYGTGSSTLKHWISEHMQADHHAGEMHFPPAWGDPPLAQSLDYRPLPFHYGYGSSTLADWISDQASSHTG